MRKLAKVVEIDDVIEHTNADALELVIIGGWQCCVKKHEFKKGDLGVYFEIDSMLPLENHLFSFLDGRNVRINDGKRYARIKTMKLRGEISQGLILPLSSLDLEHSYNVDDDLTEVLGIVKYEVTSNEGMCSRSAGSFPEFLRKSDQERVQNLAKKIDYYKGQSFEVTYKLDGTSFTAFVFRSSLDDVYTGLCSRNVLLPTGELEEGNFYLNAFREYEIDRKLREYQKETDKFIAIQAELIGPRIQNNFEGVAENQLFVYSVFDITEQEYYRPAQARKIVTSLGLEYVPVFDEYFTLDHSVKELVELADGKSALNGKMREGLVFKCNNLPFSFKAVSNRYLLKCEK